LAGDRFIAPGTRVGLHGTWVQDGVETPKSEYGVVVHCWLNDEIRMYDCLVLFFGEDFPVGEPIEEPYLLRYGATSLDDIPED
jgi:hypothetical protein